MMKVKSEGWHVPKQRELSYRKLFSPSCIFAFGPLTLHCSLCADIIRSFIHLDDETQQRNIVAWRPVVIDVIEGLTNFQMDSFSKHIETFYPLVITLLEKEVNNDLRGAIWAFLRRTGECKFGMPEYVPRGRGESVSSERGQGLTPISPGPSHGGHMPISRRASRVSNR